MTMSIGIPSFQLHRSPALSAARLRRARLRRAARWGQVAWASFIVGSVALALGRAGFVVGFAQAGIVGLTVWVVAYGVVIYGIRARAMARGDRTLQEHIARVQRSRYRRMYPVALTVTDGSADAVHSYRPSPALLSPGAD